MCTSKTMDIGAEGEMAIGKQRIQYMGGIGGYDRYRGQVVLFPIRDRGKQ